MLLNDVMSGVDGIASEGRLVIDPYPHPNTRIDMPKINEAYRKAKRKWMEEYFKHIEGELETAWLNGEQFYLEPDIFTIGRHRRHNIWELTWYDYCRAKGLFSRSVNYG